MLTIPEVRRDLTETATKMRLEAEALLKEALALEKFAKSLRSRSDQLHFMAADIDGSVNEMHRRKAVRTPPKSVPMSPAIEAGIKRYKRKDPKASHQEIANALSVNTGRISEALRGKRK